jgi:hypothetical protein
MAGAVETTANRIAVKPHGMPAGVGPCGCFVLILPRRDRDVKKPVDTHPADGLRFARAHSRHHPRAGGADPDGTHGRGVPSGLARTQGAGNADQAHG